MQRNLKVSSILNSKWKLISKDLVTTRHVTHSVHHTSYYTFSSSHITLHTQFITRHVEHSANHTSCYTLSWKQFYTVPLYSCNRAEVSVSLWLLIGPWTLLCHTVIYIQEWDLNMTVKCRMWLISYTSYYSTSTDPEITQRAYTDSETGRDR